MKKTATKKTADALRRLRIVTVPALFLTLSGVAVQGACQHDTPSVTASTPAAAGPDAAKTPPAAAEALATVRGRATWYGAEFDGKPMANGEPFRSDQPLAAHPDWPFGTRVRVTNLDNDRTHVVHVGDRGPSEKQQDKGVIVDLSRSAADALDFTEDGVTEVRLEVLEWGDED